MNLLHIQIIFEEKSYIWREGWRYIRIAGLSLNKRWWRVGGLKNCSYIYRVVIKKIKVMLDKKELGLDLDTSNPMGIVKQYHLAAKKFALEYDADHDHIISIIASVMMTRDKQGLRGGGFVQAVVDNNLFEAVSKADIICQNYLKVIVAACQYAYLE
jgi:hypothetical protein